MLILERKINDVITITSPTGEHIHIHMIETSRGKTKFGINAPEDYLILRDELSNKTEKICL